MTQAEDADIELMISHAEMTGHRVENNVQWLGWMCLDCTVKSTKWDVPLITKKDEEDCGGCRYPAHSCPKEGCKWVNHPEFQNVIIRPGWDSYFLDIAQAVAARGDCTRRQVGAVIVDQNHRVMATGYNGAAPGGPSCLAGDCPRGRMSKEVVVPGSSYDTGAGACIALHAEQNALLYSSWTQNQQATCYVTCEPCEGCMRMLTGSGVKRVVWRDEKNAIISLALQG